MLAVLVLVLGILSGVGSLVGQKQTDEVVREGDVEMIDAMSNARQPVWFTVVNPIIGVVGVLIGAGLRGTPKS